MIFYKNTKILRIKIDSISVKEKETSEEKEKITFFLNDIKFETDRGFVSEKSFLECFLMGAKIFCTHKFEESQICCETVLNYNVYYEDGIAMIVLV